MMTCQTLLGKNFDLNPSTTTTMHQKVNPSSLSSTLDLSLPDINLPPVGTEFNMQEESNSHFQRELKFIAAENFDFNPLITPDVKPLTSLKNTTEYEQLPSSSPFSFKIENESFSDLGPAQVLPDPNLGPAQVLLDPNLGPAKDPPDPDIPPRRASSYHPKSTIVSMSQQQQQTKSMENSLELNEPPHCDSMRPNVTCTKSIRDQPTGFLSAPETFMLNTSASDNIEELYGFLICPTRTPPSVIDKPPETSSDSLFDLLDQSEFARETNSPASATTESPSGYLCEVSTSAQLATNNFESPCVNTSSILALLTDSRCVVNDKKVKESCPSSKEEELNARRGRSRICDICSIDSGNYNLNYGANSCLGCRAFFRRTVQARQDTNWVCKDNEKCDVSYTNRNNCKRCRLLKCLKAGMSPERVLDKNGFQKRFKKMILKQEAMKDQGVTRETSADEIMETKIKLQKGEKSVVLRNQIECRGTNNKMKNENFEKNSDNQMKSCVKNEMEKLRLKRKSGENSSPSPSNTQKLKIQNLQSKHGSSDED